MSDLNEDARRVIEMGLSKEGPTRSDFERGRNRLLAQLAAGTSILGASSSGAAAGGKALGVAWLSKLGVFAKVLGAALGIGAIAGGVYLSSKEDEPPAVPDRGAEPQVQARKEAAHPSVVPDDDVESGASEPEQLEDAGGRAPGHPGGTPRKGAQHARGDGAGGSPPSAPTLKAELSLLRAAQAALRNGKAEQVLAILDAPVSGGPRLAEERATLRVAALCALGRIDEARVLGARFLQASPTSPLAERVRGSCVVRP